MNQNNPFKRKCCWHRQHHKLMSIDITLILVLNDSTPNGLDNVHLFVCSFELCLDWWKMVEWSGNESYFIVWFCKNWMEWNGVECDGTHSI